MPLDKSFFISEELHARTVALADGTEHTVHFREVGLAQVRGYQLAQNSEDEEVQAGAIAKLIAASVCDPDGRQSMSYETATSLKPNAASALLREILELNASRSAAAKKPSPSGAQNGSGMSSPSPLAAVPSESSSNG